MCSVFEHVHRCVCICICVWVRMCVHALVAVLFLQLLDHVALVYFLQALCTLDAQL